MAVIASFPPQKRSPTFLAGSSTSVTCEGKSDRKQTDAEFTSELTVYFTGLLEYISQYQEYEVFVLSTQTHGHVLLLAQSLVTVCTTDLTFLNFRL